MNICKAGFVAGVLLALASCEGQEEESRTNLIGGRITGAGAPYNAVVSIITDDAIRCTGTLVARDLVLTTAPCAPPVPEQAEVGFGSWDNTVKVAAARTIAPNSRPFGMTLLRLEGEAPEGVEPLPLSSRPLERGRLVIRAGYGTVLASQSGKLTHVTGRIARTPTMANGLLLEVTREGTFSTGDAGGPLVVIEDRKAWLAGLALPCRECPGPFDTYLDMRLNVKRVVEAAAALTGRDDAIPMIRTGVPRIPVPKAPVRKNLPHREPVPWPQETDEPPTNEPSTKCDSWNPASKTPAECIGIAPGSCDPQIWTDAEGNLALPAQCVGALPGAP